MRAARDGFDSLVCDWPALAGVLEVHWVRFQHELLRHAHALVPNPSDAEDLVQQTWLTVLCCAYHTVGDCCPVCWINGLSLLLGCGPIVEHAQPIPPSALDSPDAFGRWLFCVQRAAATDMRRRGYFGSRYSLQDPTVLREMAPGGRWSDWPFYQKSRCLGEGSHVGANARNYPPTFDDADADSR